MSAGTCPNCVTLLATLKGADAEITRLRAPAWWCLACDTLTSGDACGKCRAAKPSYPTRRA